MYIYQVKTQPTKGVLTNVSNTGQFTYTPNNCQVGTDTIVWEVRCDGFLLGEQTTTINIAGSIEPISTLTEERCVGGELFDVYVDTNPCSATYNQETLVKKGLCPCDIVVDMTIANTVAQPVSISVVSEGIAREVFFENTGTNYTLYINAIKDGDAHDYSIAVTDGDGKLVGTHCITNYKCCD